MINTHIKIYHDSLWKTDIVEIDFYVQQRDHHRVASNQIL